MNLGLGAEEVRCFGSLCWTGTGLVLVVVGCFVGVGCWLLAVGSGRSLSRCGALVNLEGLAIVADRAALYTLSINLSGFFSLE